MKNVINATPEYYVPGMSGEVIRMLYGRGLPEHFRIDGNAIPKENVMFNDEQFFEKGIGYPYEKEEGVYEIMNFDDDIGHWNGCIRVDEETLFKYFHIREN